MNKTTPLPQNAPKRSRADLSAQRRPTMQVRETKIATNPRKELVREQLIDIAAELFDKKGYAQTSINDIAKALGLGRSAVYHYFRNKEEILAALVDAEALTPSHFLQELSGEPGLTATERLRRAVVDSVIRRLSSGARFILLSRLEAQIPEELGPVYKLGRRHIYEFYVRCISEGIESGEFRSIDPKVAAFAVIGMANWTSRWYTPSGPLTSVAIADIIADFALQGLRAQGGRSCDTDSVRRAVDGLKQQIDTLESLLK